jgi:translation initiation factor 2B subunit (eIF-2B alpha/beta/delta family)
MSGSDTPRTDEILTSGGWDRGNLGATLPNFCRQLERELTAARAEIEEYAEDKSRLATMAMEFKEQRDRAWQTIAEINRGSNCFLP